LQRLKFANGATATSHLVSQKLSEMARIVRNVFTARSWWQMLHYAPQNSKTIVTKSIPKKEMKISILSLPNECDTTRKEHYPVWDFLQKKNQHSVQLRGGISNCKV